MSLWKTLKAVVLPALIGLSLLALIGVGGAALVLFREASELHPVLGWLVLGVLVAGAVLVFVWPVSRLARLPRGLQRPEVAEGEDWERYLAAYGKRLVRNRRVREGYAGYAELEAAVRSKDAAALEREMDRAVNWLDRRARAVVARHAAAVFASTAVSQSGRLDTGIVFAAQLRMVKEVAELYYQRPGLREMVRLYANVGATAFLAGEMEDSEVLAVLGAPITAGITGLIPVGGTDPLVSLLVNSLLDGSTNAFLTLRIGVLARRHCGLRLEPDRGLLARSASLEAAGMLADTVGHGARRVANVTRQAVTRRAVSGPRRVVESAVRGTSRIADAAVKGTERTAEGVADMGVSLFDKIRGLAGGHHDRTEPTVTEVETLENSVGFWENVAQTLRSEGKDDLTPPDPAAVK